jgi:hypothetical protein
MDKLKNNIDQLFANKIFTTVFVVYTSIFAAHIAPKLPKRILQLFNADITKIIFMGFIVYSASKNMAIGLVTAIGLIILMQSLRSLENKERVINKITESTQIVSDSKVQMINGLIANKEVDSSQKSVLLDNIMQSAASDKHKFNSGLIAMQAEPEQTSQIIDKLYTGVTNQSNTVNMTHRLIKSKPNYIIRVVKNLLQSPIDEEVKAVTIIKVLKSDIPPKVKIYALKKVKKSTLPVETKNMIFDHLENKSKNEHFVQDFEPQVLTKEDFIGDEENPYNRILSFLETNEK